MFWNTKQTVKYFADKAPDFRVISIIESDKKRPLYCLDLGCGGGRHISSLLQMGLDCVGCDVNESMLQSSKDRLVAEGYSSDKIKFGDIRALPYEDNLFDYVVCTGIFHQVIGTSEYVQAIKEVARVMKKNGIIILNIFTNTVWDPTYRVLDDYAVETKENLLMTLLPTNLFIEMMNNQGLFELEKGSEDEKLENTGPRSVYRAAFVKR